jgi:hypothetical protein
MKMPALMTPKNAVIVSHMMRSLTQRSHQTLCKPAQSKEFSARPEFQKQMMILCNSYHGLPP